jgi:hypothetical protein
MTEVVQAYHVGPEWSLFLVWGCCFIPLFGVLFVAIRRIAVNLRLARDAEREHPVAGLRPGHAVIAGKVRRGDGKAVRIEIDQVGVERRTKNGYSHSWNETARRVTVDPFEIELASGERVAVAADEKVFLVDKLDGVKRTDHHNRTRIAELSEGEAVYAVGVIEYGDPDPKAGGGHYREAPVRKLLMRAPRGKQLLIASERLGRRFRARVWFHSRWVFYTLLGFALVHGAMFGGYHLRMFAGHAVSATVTQLRTYTVRGGKSSTTYHWVDATLDGTGTSEHLDARRGSYWDLKVGSRIQVRVVDGWPKASALGSGPTASAERAVWMIIILLLFVSAFVGARDMSRPWYDKPKILDTGSGRLVPPPG